MRAFTRRSFVSMMVGIMMFFAASIASAAEAPDVIKLKKDLEITREMVVKDVIVVDGDLTVLGRVEGNVVVVGGIVYLKPGSYVGGSIAVVGELSKDPSAQVIGKITQVYMPRFIPSIITFFSGGWAAFWVAASILAFLGFLGLSVLVTALVPSHMHAMAHALEKSFFVTFLWGILWTALIVPVAVLLAISIVGIALIPLEILLVALALLVGYIASSIFIGNMAFRAAKRPPVPFLNAIIGLIALFLIGLIPVIGAVAKSVFLIAGYGAVVTTRFGCRRNPAAG